MTVSSIVPVNTYAGNGSVKRFDFDYLVENPSQLLVQLTDKEGVQTNLIFGTDYSIDKLDQKNGSFITYPLDSSTHSILASDEKITLSLDLDIEQEKEYANSSKLNLITLEYSLDYITRILQIQQRQIDRSIKIQEGSDIIPEKLVSELFQAEKNAKESEVNAKASELAAKASEDSAAATVDGFDVHALEKQGEFNANAKEKQTLINASADAAKLSELNARKYANGTIEEYPAGSAKYWADTAANIVGSGVIDDSRPSTATTYSSQKEVNTFLDKSGDTMTGALRFNDSGYIERNNSAATKGLALFGDKDGYGAGASIALRSNLASGSQAGVFKFETGNNVTGHTHTLQGSPDGSFTCDGKEIIRSINGQEADATGNIDVVSGQIVGQTIFSLDPLYEAGIHLFDGALIEKTGIYKDFYTTYLTNLKTKHPERFVTEEEWQASVSKYGVCGKYVDGDTTFRLPKVTGIVEGTLDVKALGDVVEAGLPNITGGVNMVPAQTTELNKQWGSGAFKKTRTSSWNNCQSGGGSQPTVNSVFDASDSDPTYGKSTTVQPQTIKGYLYLVMANSTKTKVEVNIDNIVTDLNDKADVDLVNCTKPYVIETYVNGNSGYRVWSDGFIEQWGRTPGVGGTPNCIIGFLKPFKTDNYTFSFLRGGGFNWDATRTDFCISGRARHQIQIGTRSGTDGQGNWYACGY